MNYVEAEGSSIDDAIQRALQLLGVGREKADIEIVSNATRGLFGLGGRKAKVRATLRTPFSLDSQPGSAAAPSSSTKTTPDRAAPPAARPAAPRPAQPLPGKSKPAPNESPAAEPDAAAGHQPVHSPPPAAELDSQTLDRARSVMQDTLRLMNTAATVEVVQDKDGARLVLEGDTSGVLIGRRGQTLDALEYLINRIAARDDEHPAHLIVDSQGYRARRRQSLEDMAQRLAEQVRRRGKVVTLNPMSPRDRRIVHLALQDCPSLVTRSSGKGYLRKLLIIPEGHRSGPRKR